MKAKTLAALFGGILYLALWILALALFPTPALFPLGSIALILSMVFAGSCREGLE